MCQSNQACELVSGHYQCVTHSSSSSSSSAPSIFLRFDFPPTNGAIGYPITVYYRVTGSNALADNVVLQLDGNPEVQNLPLTVGSASSYTFTNSATAGTHTVRGYIALADHTKIFGSDASVTFSTIGGSNSSVGQSPNDVFLGGPYCGTLFWVNDTYDKVQNARLDGSSPITTKQQNYQFPKTEVAFDPIRKKMYWMDWVASANPPPDNTYRLRMANYDGSNPQDVLPSVITNYYQVSMLAIDPIDQQIYWSNYDACGSFGCSQFIHRVNYDGSNPQDIISFGTNGYVLSLVLDKKNNNIFYASQNNTIVRTDSAGHYNTTIYTAPSAPIYAQGSAVMGLAVDTSDVSPLNHRLYWVDTRVGKLYSSNIDGTNPVALLSNLPAPTQTNSFLGIETVVIDAKNKVLYYGLNLNTTPSTLQIKRVNFDGTTPVVSDVLQSQGSLGTLGTPLAIDVERAGTCDGGQASSSSSSPPPAVCGNGVIEAGEQCDDANTSDRDACFSNCRWVVPPISLP
jgi:cysteine-rich repeat protein